MTKKELVLEISRNTYYSRAMVEKVLDCLAENIAWELSHGRKVQVEGIGVFEPKKRAPRTGRNPHTGEAVPIPARVLPSFKAGKQLRDAVERWK